MKRTRSIWRSRNGVVRIMMRTSTRAAFRLELGGDYKVVKASRSPQESSKQDRVIPRLKQRKNLSDGLKIAAGLRTVMTPEQRREFLMNSEYGRVTGLADLLSRNKN